MHGKIIVLLLAAAFSHGICAGEIYRCTTGNGEVMYTNITCPANAQAQRVASYEPEAVVRSAQVDAEAAQAAAISARLAQQAAADARAAAYEAQAAYRDQAEGEQRANYNHADNQPWYPAYPYYGAGFAGSGSGGGGHRHHHDGGGHDGSHGGHGGGRHGAPMQFQAVSASSVNLLVRH